MNRVDRALTVFVLLALAPAAMAESSGQNSDAVSENRGFEVAGISASGSEDDPRVLYILPWQAPSLPRRPRAELNQQAPELTRPVSTQTLEGHRQFRETLNPLVLQPSPAASGQTQP